MKWAIIENETVINVIEATEDFVTNNNLNAINVDNEICGVGFRYENQEFIAPIASPEINELEAE